MPLGQRIPLILLALIFLAACGGSGGGGNGNDDSALGDMNGTWEGSWVSGTAAGRDGSFTARVVQSGGALSGHIDIPYIAMDNAPLTGTVSGSQITFGDIDQTITFVGRVAGESCSGSFSIPTMGESGTWTALRSAGGDTGNTAGLDSEFGAGGVLVTDLHLTPAALAVQSGGRILIAGNPMSNFSVDEVQIVALTSSGRIDEAFGDEGVLSSAVTPTDVERVCGLTLAEADDFYLCAQAGGDRLVLLGYESHGELNTNFGDAGQVTVTLDTGDSISAMTRAGDGKLLVAGLVSGSVGVMRFLPNGDVDSDFGTSGAATIALAGLEKVAGIAVSGAGRILVNGTAGSDFFLLGLTDAGAVDTAFAGDGVVTIDVDSADEARGLTLLSDDRILMAGFGHLDFWLPKTAILAALKSDGSLDESFGSGGVCGVRDLDNGSAPLFGSQLQVAVDGRDRIAMAGMDTNLFLVARFDSHGQIDTSFGEDGFETADFGSTGGWDFATAVAVQRDDKVIAAGVAGSSKLVVARYTP
jgi:uncharacterized delta-60 repeat protein